MTSPKDASPIASSSAAGKRARGAEPNAPPLALGSASPRRRELLAQIRVTPDIVDPPDIDEAPTKAEIPRAYARRMAEEKAAAVAARNPGALVLAADTVVALGRRILDKPDDARAARRCLTLLSGRRHRVISGVVLIAPGGRQWTRLVETQVAFKRLSAAEIGAYLDSGEWRGKAGGYAIQGLAAAFCKRINGSYSNVVGLPLAETATLLEAAGYPLWRSGDGG